MTSIVFYLLVFAIVFFVQICAGNVKKPVLKKCLILFSFLILLLLMGLRFEVGTDYVGHVRTYESFVGKSFTEIWSSGGDVGSRLIIGGLASIGGDVKMIFWIYGLLTLIPLYKINKNSNFRYLAYSTLVFNLTVLPVCLNIMRQGTAMAFILLAFDYVRHDKKIGKVLMCAVFAVLLHTSALLMIPFILCYYFSRKYNKKYYKFAIALIALISVSFLTFLKDFFVEIGFSDYNYQLVITKDMGLSSGAILYNVIFYSMLVFIIFLHRKFGEKNNRIEVLNMTTMIVGGSVFELIGSVTKYLSRISHYFSILQVLLMPELLQGIKRKDARVFAKIICITVLIGLFIFRCYVQGYYEIIPYQSWLIMG